MTHAARLSVLAASLLALRVAAAQPGPSAGSAEARVRAATADLLEERFPEAAHRLDPRVLRLSPSAPASGDLRVTLPPDDGLPSGHTRVELATEAGPAGWALLYVAQFDSVLVARRDLARGDTLTDAAVEVAWLETTRFHGDPVHPADVHGDGRPTARRSLRAGEALRASSLAWPVATDTGDRVRVRYHRRGLLLTVDGVAREAGAVGDAIRVHCRSTSATYRVRLTAPGEGDWLATL